MRIALINLGRRGASGPLSYELAVHLRPHAQVFAVLSEYAENLAVWQDAGLETLITPTYRNLPEAMFSYIGQGKFRRLAAQIRALRPDVLLYPMFFTWNPFVQHFLSDIPCIVYVHDPLPHPGLFDRVYEKMEGVAIRQATRCVLLSQAFIPDLVRRGVPQERINVIPHGGLDYYQRLAQTTAAQPASPTILFFGRITPYKGLEVLLRAVPMVRQRVPAARLLIVGEGDLSPYAGLLRGLPDVEVVNRWVGEAEIAAFFQRASVVALPYTSATQSGVLPIAAAFGLPVVATQTGGLPEQFTASESGLIVPPRDVVALAQALGDLLADPQRAAQMGANLQREYREQRNWDAIAEAVYNSCALAVQQLTADR